MWWVIAAPVMVGATMGLVAWRKRYSKQIELDKITVEPNDDPVTTHAAANPIPNIMPSVGEWKDWIEDVRNTAGVVGEICETNDSYGSHRLTVRLDTGAYIDLWINGPPYMKCPRIRDASWTDADEGIVMKTPTRENLEQALLQARARRSTPCHMTSTDEMHGSNASPPVAMDTDMSIAP